MFRNALAAAIVSISAALSSAPTDAATIGNDIINRGSADSFVNFGIALPITIEQTGTLTGWEVYINRFDTSGTTNPITLLVLDRTANGFRIADYDTETVKKPGGAFSFSSDMAVTAGQSLGLLMNRAKVAYSGGAPSSAFATSNNGLPTPTIGGFIQDRSVGNRVYSVNATIAPVPLPAAGLFLIVGIGAFAMVKRKRAS